MATDAATADATAGGDRLLSQDITVKIKRGAVSDGVPLPGYATDGASGMDVRAAEDCVIEPGGRAAVATGLSMEIPCGYECQVRPRSGLALKHGVTVLNAPGTIDSDYRGEVKIILVNFGTMSFEIKRGDRIAQLVFAPVARAVLEESVELDETERAGGGFGHTGVK